MIDKIFTGIIALAVSIGGWFGDEPKQEPQLGAFGDPFVSIQLATDPDNGECLTTDGTDNVWSSCGAGSGDITGGASRGTGVNIYDSESAGILRFNSISAGSNVSFSTTSDNNTIVISSTGGGNSFAWPFDVSANYVSTSSKPVGFLNGIFSTASSTFSGNNFFSALSQGFAYLGTGGKLNTIASSSIALSWFNNDSGFLTTVDISANTNLTAGDALTLTDDDIDFDGGASPAGDLGGTWANPSVDDDSHAHTGTTLSGIDISDDTNLTAGDHITLTGDDLDIDDDFILNTGDTYTGLLSGPYSSSTIYSSFITASTTNLNIGGQSFIGLLGNGLDNTNGILTANCVEITGSADLCDGSDASGVGGSSAYEIATTSDIALSQLAYVAKVGGRTTLASVATTTVTATAPLSLSNTVWKVGGSNSVLTISTTTTSLFSGIGGQILVYNDGLGYLPFATTSIPLAGDVTGTIGATVVGNDSHDHTSATISGIDISADTNLTAGDHITLTDDDLDVDDDFILNTGDVGTGAYTFPFASTTFLTTDGGFISNASSTIVGSTTVTTLRAGSTAIGSNVIKISPLTGLTTSNSESVGGIFNLNQGTTDALGMALYNNHTGTNRLLSLVCDAATYGGNCFHVRSDGTESAFNILGATLGKGVGKFTHQTAGDSDASILSLDASSAGYLGQGIFVDCTGGSCTGTNSAFQISDEAGNNGNFKILWNGKTGIASTTPTGARLSVNSVAGDNFSLWVGSTTAPWLRVSNSGFGTTTLSGLNIAGSATSTSNVGFNITTGCYAVAGTCISGGVGGSGDITSVGDVTDGAAFDGTQGTTLTFNNAGGDATLDYDGTDLQFSKLINFPYSSSTIYSSFITSSSTNYLGAGLQTCDPTTGKLTWANGQFSCGTDSSGSGSSKWATSTVTDAIYNATGNGGGYVGIGTTTPAFTLQVSSSTAPQLALSDGVNPHWSFRNAGGNLYLGTSSPTGFSTSTNPSPFTIMADGRVGIGSDNPEGHLFVQAYYAGFEIRHPSTDGVGNATIVTNGRADSINENVGNIYFENLGATIASISAYRDSNAASTIGRLEFNAGNNTANSVPQTLYLTSAGRLSYGTATPYAKLTVWGASTGKALEVVSSASSTLLSVSATGFGTTTLAGLNISGQATSTSNVGFNITSGCYAISGTCIGGGGGSGTVTSVGLATPNSTLSLGGTNPVTTTGTIDVDLNLGNANTWTAKQNFFAHASSTALSANWLKIGGTASTTIDYEGDVLLPAAGTLTIPALTSALLLTDGNGLFAEYGGAAACTNQFVTALSAVGGTTCASINNAQWSGTDLSVANGGTGLSTFGGTNHILYTTAADTLASEAAFTYSPTSNLLTFDYSSSTIYSSFVTASTTNFNCVDCINATEIEDLYLFNTGDVGTGAFDFGGATSLETVNGSAPTVDATGEFAVDTTSDQFIYFGATAKKVLSPVNRLGFSYATTTWNATTTILLGPAVQATTLDYMYCETNAGTVGVSIYDGTNRATYMPTASTTINRFAFSANNTFTAGESMRVDLGTPASSPTRIACTLGASVTAD